MRLVESSCKCAACLAWVVGRKEELGEGGGARRIGVRGRGSLDGGMATNVQLYLMQIAT